MTTESKDDAVQPASGIAVPELLRDVATVIEESKRRAAQHLNAELTGSTGTWASDWRGMF